MRHAGRSAAFTAPISPAVKISKGRYAACTRRPGGGDLTTGWTKRAASRTSPEPAPSPAGAARTRGCSCPCLRPTQAADDVDSGRQSSLVAADGLVGGSDQGSAAVAAAGHRALNRAMTVPVTPGDDNGAAERCGRHRRDFHGRRSPARCTCCAQPGKRQTPRTSFGATRSSGWARPVPGSARSGHTCSLRLSAHAHSPSGNGALLYHNRSIGEANGGVNTRQRLRR